MFALKMKAKLKRYVLCVNNTLVTIDNLMHKLFYRGINRKRLTLVLENAGGILHVDPRNKSPSKFLSSNMEMTLRYKLYFR